MKLRYLEIPPSEGGTAVAGCGTIHRSEVEATLTKLSDDLEMPFDFNDYVLGSTGKSEYSGDIDLVVDSKYWDQTGIGSFRQNLEEAFGKEVVARNGAMLHLKYPIVGYNSSFDERKPRTGFVQIDFNFGDVEWERFYHYSPGEESEYKGAHRNLMLAAITTVVDVIRNDTVDGYGRPTLMYRWKFGSNGLIRVQRASVKEKHTFVWKKKQDDTLIYGPHTDPAEIARYLLPVDGTPADFFSMETLMAAVKRNFGMVDQERIWRRTASNFMDWRDGKYFEYPEEITRYITEIS
jgi:hypothetical protein